MCDGVPNMASAGAQVPEIPVGPPDKEKLKVREGQELVVRPQGVNKRRGPGHVEINLMFGGVTIWQTCVDRHKRHLRLRALPG